MSDKETSASGGMTGYVKPESVWRMNEVVENVLDEYKRASKKFPVFNSAHEGYAVLREEVDELWDEIKKDQRPFEMREEAIQIAAMALRFIIDVCHT